jgi:hypothetical protein
MEALRTTEADMQLKIVVTGVCGISRQFQGRNHRILTPADYSAMGMDHVPMAGADLSTGQSHGGGVPQHFAFIQFDKNQPGLVLGDANGPFREIDFRVTKGKDFGFFVIDQEQLAMMFAGTGSPVLSPPQTIDINAAVKMIDVAPGSETVDAVLLSDQYPPDGDRVSALLDLQTGDLRTRPRDPKEVFEFKPRVGPRRVIGSFAQELVYTLNLPGEPWDLTSLPFTEDPPPNPILRFTGSATSFEITFGNAPLDDILGLNPDPNEDVDVHFMLIYSLPEALPAALPLPRRVSARRTVVRAGGANCPPAVFE